MPGGDEVRRRGEGVAIVLSGEAVRAWKEGGGRWSLRLVSATLKVGNGSRDRLHILSCYAPTFAASREDIQHFLCYLQDSLSAIPSDEGFVMLGDYNARVGSRNVDERGPHGYGDLNDAGRELLSFLSTNEATVCNSCKTFISRHGSTPSLASGTALTMSSCGRPTGGSVWMSR